VINEQEDIGIVTAVSNERPQSSRAASPTAHRLLRELLTVSPSLRFRHLLFSSRAVSALHWAPTIRGEVQFLRTGVWSALVVW